MKYGAGRGNSLRNYQGARDSRSRWQRPKANPLLYGEQQPERAFRREKPWHRLAADMMLNGVEYKTIARSLGKTVQAVRQALRQDFVTQYVVEESKKRSACDEIRTILETEGPDSLRRIVQVAKTKEGTPLGFEADKEVLNRLLGRPTQPITHDQPPVKDLDFDELRQQVNRIVTGVPGTNGNSEGPNGMG